MLDCSRAAGQIRKRSKRFGGRRSIEMPFSEIRRDVSRLDLGRRDDSNLDLGRRASLVVEVFF